jgi:hypothetical protein
MPTPRPVNLLVLGASGGVARAFLRRLPAHRAHFGRVVLVDYRRELLEDPYLDLRALDATFVTAKVDPVAHDDRFRALLRRHRTDIVVDLATVDTLPVLDSADAEGVTVINTGLCDEKLHLDSLTAAIRRRPPRWTNAPHILCSGMNPGLVNMWAMHGVARFGVPRDIVIYEYDDSVPALGWRPCITWSPHEFLNEAVREPSGRVVSGRIEWFAENSLQRQESLQPWLGPVRQMTTYPVALTILHEENVTLGERLGVSSRFLYAIDPRTVAYLTRLWRRQGAVKDSDLVRADHRKILLRGGEHIGVCLDYGDRRVYYANELANAALVGVNATCAQVALGVVAALLTRLTTKLSAGVHFVGDLLDTRYRQLAFDALTVEQHVFRRRGRRWVRTGFLPLVRWRSPGARVRVAI